VKLGDYTNAIGTDASNGSLILLIKPTANKDLLLRLPNQALPINFWAGEKGGFNSRYELIVH
jgi:hypothetical protein